MIIFPAIDLIDGNCVRLERGEFDAVTTYDTDPLARAQAFAAAGATHLMLLISMAPGPGPRGSRAPPCTLTSSLRRFPPAATESRTFWGPSSRSSSSL